MMKSECIEVDGFIYGHYSFAEYGDKRYSGVFPVFQARVSG